MIYAYALYKILGYYELRASFKTIVSTQKNLNEHWGGARTPAKLRAPLLVDPAQMAANYHGE